MQTERINDVLDTQTLLDAITTPCLVINTSGQVKTSNSAFKKTLRNVNACRLESILDNPEDISNVMKTIIRNRRAQFHDIAFDPLIYEFYIQSTRLSLNIESSPLFLIEFHKRDEMLLPFNELYEQRKNLASVQTSLMQTKASLKEAHIKANTDALTGIANRRAFDEHLMKVWARAYKERQSLSLVLFDLDFFKAVNDELGHAKGDLVLIKVASALHQQLKRETDLFCRFGGEEFAAILYGADTKGAITVALRLIEYTRKLAIPHPSSTVSKFVTVSAGCHTAWPSKMKLDTDSLLHGADLALYKAKDNGRNRAYHKLSEG